jgi:hypothetical protein
MALPFNGYCRLLACFAVVHVHNRDMELHMRK